MLGILTIRSLKFIVDNGRIFKTLLRTILSLVETNLLIHVRLLTFSQYAILTFLT